VREDACVYTHIHTSLFWNKWFTGILYSFNPCPTVYTKQYSIKKMFTVASTFSGINCSDPEGESSKLHLNIYHYLHINMVPNPRGTELSSIFLPRTSNLSLLMVMVKVECTLVQALRLCTGHTAHRGSIGIALLFHDHGTRRG